MLSQNFIKDEERFRFRAIYLVHRGVLALFLAPTSDPSSIIRSSSALRLSFTAYINGVIPVVCKRKILA